MEAPVGLKVCEQTRANNQLMAIACEQRWKQVGDYHWRVIQRTDGACGPQWHGTVIGSGGGRLFWTDWQGQETAERMVLAYIEKRMSELY